MKRSVALSMVLLLTIAARPNETKPVWHGPDQPVYVVTKNHYAEGFGPDGATARFSDLIAIEIFDPKPRAASQDATYNIGEQIKLFSGGEPRGTIKVQKVLGLQCDSSAVIVSATPPLKWEHDVMALATNASAISGHENSQRPANDDEKAAAKRFAMDEFRKHGVPEPLAKEIQLEQSIVTKLQQSSSVSLIGYAFIKTKTAVHEVFLIANLETPNPSVEFTRYHVTKDVEDGKDSENYRFVDQLDLDGDGTDEIVVEVTGYESEEFRILKRINGSWRRVHVGGQGGC